VQLGVPQTIQSLLHEILKLDDAATALSLGIVEEKACLGMLNGSTNTYRAAVPIDVALLESQIFAGSHSGGQRQSVQREPFRFSSDRKKSPALLNA